MEIKNKVLVTLANKSHIKYAKNLFANAVLNGKWDGDLCLLTTYDENDHKELLSFEDKRINIVIGEELPKTPPIQFYKYYLFHDYFRQWEWVFYCDLDSYILGNIDDIHLGKQPGFYANKDGETFHNQFDCTSYDDFKNTGWNKLDTPQMKYIKNNYEDTDSFQTCYMLYNTDWLENKSFEKFVMLHDEYYDITNHYTIEQSVINLYMYDKWGLLSDKFINRYEFFYEEEDFYDDKDYKYFKCIHFGRWAAPWLKHNIRFHKLWTESLNEYEKNKKFK